MLGSGHAGRSPPNDLAGGQLSMSQQSQLPEGMTSGIGTDRSDVMPPQFAQMIPYVVRLMGLTVLARKGKSGANQTATPALEGP